jgi:integrase
MARRFLRLTHAAVRALEPGQHITEQGIRTDVKPNGDVQWAVDVQIHGNRICRVIGLASAGITRADCVAFLEKHRSAARAGQLALPAGHRLPQSIDDLGKFYLSQLRATGGRDQTNAEQHWRLHIWPYFTGQRVDAITPLSVEQFRAALRAKGLSEGTVYLVLASWRRMGRKLAQWKVISQPLPTIPLPAPKNARERVLSRDEARALLQAAQYDHDPDIGLFIRVGLATSLRHREILSARWEDFDFAARRLRVQVKGGSWRRQPLPPSIAEILARLQRERGVASGWVFPSSRTKVGHRTSLRWAFERCVKAAGLDPTEIIPHTMRHTAITWLSARGGVDLKTLQSFSGHKSVAMVLRYTHAEDATIDAALTRFDAADAEPDRVVPLPKSRQSPDRARKASNGGG